MSLNFSEEIRLILIEFMTAIKGAGFMRVVFSVGQYDKKSGIIKVVNNIVKILSNMEKYDISILCTGIEEQSKDVSLDNVRIYNMDIEKYGHRKKYLYYVKNINKILLKMQPDIIIVSGTEHVLFYSLAIRKMGVNTPKMLVWEHRNFEAGPRFRLEWIGKRIALKRWNGVLCITKKDCLEYKEHTNNPEKIHQIYNLTDYTVTKKIYKESSKKIISCGYLAPIKGFDMLIKVAKLVFEKHPDWVWDIYGEGSEKENLQNLINKNGLQDNLFLKGYESQINSLYQEYAFFVLTSRKEGMGMVLIEALKSGLPVVSFDIKCGPSDVVTDEVNGYLIEPFDIEKMSKKINLLIENKIKRKEFSNASEIKLKEFEENIIISKWINLLQEMSE